MKKTKCSLFFLTAILFVTFGLNLPSVYAQDYPNTVTFDNKSGEPALVKLIGPMSQAIKVPKGQSRPVNVAKGEYHILVRYGSDPANYTYTRGDTFVVRQTETQYSGITITLHKVIGGNYQSHPISHETFDQVGLSDTLGHEEKAQNRKPITSAEKASSGGMSETISIKTLAGPMQFVKSGDWKDSSKGTASEAAIAFDLSDDRTSITKITISIDEIKYEVKSKSSGVTETRSGTKTGVVFYLHGPFPITNGAFQALTGTDGNNIKGRFISSTEAMGTIHLFDSSNLDGKNIKIDLGLWNWRATGK